MRTIEFSNDDIKECKLALVNQNLTPLQSAFLMQYITNLQQALIDIKNKIEEMQIEFELKRYVTNFCEKLDMQLQIIEKVLGDSDD